MLNKQLVQKDQELVQNQQQLVQKDQELEQKTLELEDERQYRLGLEEGLLTNTSPLEPTQIIYIATSTSYSKQNRFKIGGVASLENLEGRLATYNTRSANGDDFFYVEWYPVACYRDVEKRLDTLIGRFRDRKTKEMYIMHYTNLRYIIEYIVAHYSEETETVNEKMEEFIRNLNRTELRPAIVNPKPLNRVYIQRIGQPDVVITTNTTESLADRLEMYINNLDTDTEVVNAKHVFDNLEIKKNRRALYLTLSDVLKRLLPNAKMVKF